MSAQEAARLVQGVRQHKKQRASCKECVKVCEQAAAVLQADVNAQFFCRGGRKGGQKHKDFWGEHLGADPELLAAFALEGAASGPA